MVDRGHICEGCGASSVRAATTIVECDCGLLLCGGCKAEHEGVSFGEPFVRQLPVADDPDDICPECCCGDCVGACEVAA